jgi:hypothetical protein
MGGHVTSMGEKRAAHRVLVVKREEKKAFGRSRSRCENDDDDDDDSTRVMHLGRM